MSDPAASMIANLQAKTGRSLEEWAELARGTGLPKHGQIVAHLKTEHGLGHGYANLIALTALKTDDEAPSDSAIVDAQYAGKEHLRPVYTAIVTSVRTFGDDVEVAPKKASVSLRRAKQFALVTPATRTRVDLGINLIDEEPTERLLAATGMCTHKVALSRPEDVDAEVIEWLRRAYQAAGSRP